MTPAITSFVELNLPEVKSYIYKTENGNITKLRTVWLDRESKIDMYKSGWIYILLAKYGELIQDRLELDDSKTSTFEVMNDVLRDQLAYVHESMGSIDLKPVLETIFEYADIEVAKGNPDEETPYLN